MSEWQPIETAPKIYGTRIIGYPVVLDRNTGGVGVAKLLCESNIDFIGKQELVWKNDNNRIVNPTHWMALPVPPEDNNA